jgi:hypothetical protein
VEVKRVHELRESGGYDRSGLGRADGRHRDIAEWPGKLPRRIRRTGDRQAPPYDPQHFVRVDETITLTLHDLKPHTLVTVAFDLYILKSWDGNNQTYGPGRWALRVQNGPTLLDTTFSNNPKTGADLSQQTTPSRTFRSRPEPNR